MFGAGFAESTGLPEKDDEGIVCFITVAGFLNGPGFEKMRDDLRRTCSEIWVIDCSPEGHQPEVATRIFQGVQQPVCIVLAAKKLGKSREEPATVRYMSLAKGRREEKFLELGNLSLHKSDWIDCPPDWRAPFLPTATGVWAQFPALQNLFNYNGSGVMPGRTWIISPDQASLKDRWAKLISEKDGTKKELLFHPHLRNGKPGDKHVQKKLAEGLAGHPSRLYAVVSDNDVVIEPTRMHSGHSIDSGLFQMRD